MMQIPAYQRTIRLDIASGCFVAVSYGSDRVACQGVAVAKLADRFR